MSKELDIAVARAMGYRVVKDAQNVRGCQVGTAGRKGHDLPYYSEDATFVPVLTAWIEARGVDMIAWYMANLWEQTRLNEHRHAAGERYEWVYICATPEQHCRAFIACMQGDKA